MSFLKTLWFLSFFQKMSFLERSFFQDVVVLINSCPFL